MIALKPTKGHLLVAEPSIIGDVSFNRSVVLLADHSDNGSVGFILNKILDFAEVRMFAKKKCFTKSIRNLILDILGP